MRALYQRMPIGARAIQYQLRRNNLSHTVETAFIAELGVDGWRFVCGEVDTLADRRADHVAS